ncbi:MAG: glutathione S-transferase family protein [Alphaproteobacteria bacterium]|nr:glutathione S-transferase family protein [Alphaproteobacteria bacterium]
MLELYHDWDSLCSFKVRVALAEKGLAWVDRRVALNAFEHLRPAYLALNPNGVVPTLVHDGKVVIESSVVNEYLDDVFAAPALRPADPHDRAEMRVWVKYQDDVIHHAVRPPTFQLMIKKRVRELPPGAVEAMVRDHPMPERGLAYRKIATDPVDLDAVRAGIARFEEIVGRMDQALARGPWLAGATFSLADCAVSAFVDRVEHLRMGRLFETSPRVAGWVARIKARPSYRAACPAAENRLPRPDDAAMRALAMA